MKLIKLICLLSLSSLSLLANSASAWELDATKSVVSFVSIKKHNIGEVHVFTQLEGQIKNAAATISIKTESIDSLIPLRDERMRKFLFKSNVYPTIDINADVTQALSSLDNGAPQLVEVPATLSLHGVTTQITLNAYLTQSDENTLSVISTKPIIIRAAQYQLVEGITKLASLVNNLPIAESVPVTFALTFTK